MCITEQESGRGCQLTGDQLQYEETRTCLQTKSWEAIKTDVEDAGETGVIKRTCSKVVHWDNEMRLVDSIATANRIEGMVELVISRLR